MPFFLECHHAIGKPLASPLTDYRWEPITLGGGHDAGYDSLTDLRLAEARDALMARPDVAGVRVVFRAAKPAPVGPPAAPPKDGQVVLMVGR
jgi:hypothetical protein